MNYDSKKNTFDRNKRRAFTFMEVITALVIVSVICFGVLVVINRGVAAMLEGQARAQAFELARENMENLISGDVVADMTEFGTHELNDKIEWETIVEPFDEPVNSDMWIRAVCTASYLDRYDERQTIELVHWITNLSSAQQKLIADQQKRENEFLENMEGNPFGDDAAGLMKYGKALRSMGHFARAAEAFLRVVQEFADSMQAAPAFHETVSNVWGALAEGDTETIIPIIEEIKADFPDDDNVQELPDPDKLELDKPIPQSAIPPQFRPSTTKPGDSSSNRPGSDPSSDNPDSGRTDDSTGGNSSSQQGDYRGIDLPADFDSWPEKDQQTWKGLVDMLKDR